MKLNKILLFILTSIFLINLTACNSNRMNFDTVYISLEDTDTETSQITTEIATESEIETESTEVISQPETLRFVDAHGEWFETEIVSSAKKHPYNWD